MFPAINLIIQFDPDLQVKKKKKPSNKAILCSTTIM